MHFTIRHQRFIELSKHNESYFSNNSWFLDDKSAEAMRKQWFRSIQSHWVSWNCDISWYNYYAWQSVFDSYNWHALPIM